MLRLLYFVPCEQLLYSERSVASLISVLESVEVSGEIADELPANAGLPKQWTAVALWRRIEDVPQPVECSCKMELFSPDGKSSVGGIVSFTVSNQHINFRNNVNFPIFPIGQNGTYLLKLFLKTKVDADFDAVGEFPINVNHAIKVVVNEDQNENNPKIEIGQSTESV